MTTVQQIKDTEDLARSVGVRRGHIWTWAPGTAAEQDVMIVQFGIREGTDMIETRQVIRGGFTRDTTEWNELIHFVHMAVFCNDDREAYDKGTT